MVFGGVDQITGEQEHWGRSGWLGPILRGFQYQAEESGFIEGQSTLSPGE